MAWQHHVSPKRAFLVDLVVYFGGQDVDLAMTRLFGEFENRFYKVYEKDSLVELGWQNRLDVWSMRPVLDHFKLFGVGCMG